MMTYPCNSCGMDRCECHRPNIVAPSAQPAESSARERRLAEAAKELLACLKSEHSRCPGYRIVEDIGPNADAQDCAPCEVCELIARSVDVSAYGLEVRRDG